MGPTSKLLVVLVAGLICAITGIVLYKFFPSIIEAKVKETLNLGIRDDMSFKNWRKLSQPMYMKFYIFDVVNPDGVVKDYEKPNLKEKGPFTFRETREKRDLSWNDDEDTVSYRQTRTYFFEPTLSKGTLDDLVTIPNVPALIIVQEALKMEQKKIDQLAGGISLFNVKPYMKKTVGELLFDGYVDTLAQLAQKVSGIEALPGGRFAFFLGKNDTDDGEYTVNTGVKDISKFATIQKWEGQKRLTIWDDNGNCNEIRGTDGSQFPPFVTKDSKLTAFVSEIVRSVELKYKEEVTHHGITAYRFSSNLLQMADPAVNPDNECFCGPEECMFTGLVSMAKLQFNASIYTSPPHFFLSDPLLLKGVEGLKPNLSEHGNVLDIEPLTGVVLNGARKSQVNVLMSPSYPQLEDTEFVRLPKMIHPIFWLEEGATIDEKNADMFKAMAVTPKKIGTGVIIALIVIGILLVLVAMVLCICKKREKEVVATSSSQMKLTSL